MNRALWEQSGFLKSVRPLWEYAKDEGVKVTQKEVKAFLDKQSTVQTHRRPQKQKVFNTIWASKNDYQWQTDVTFPKRSYQGFRAIVVLVDVHSRKMAAVPITSRQQLNDGPLTQAFRKAITQLGGAEAPENINADHEFDNKVFLAWAKKHGVNVYFSNPDEDMSTKNAIVERLNGTLLDMLETYGRNTGRKDWPTFLPKVVKAYNIKKHTTVKGKPSQIYDGKQPNLQKVIRLKSRFKAGQKVRLKLKKKQFQKGFEQTYSDTVYVLVKRDEKLKNRWILRDVATGEIKKTPQAEANLSIIYDVEEPPEKAREGKREMDKEDAKRTQRQRTEKEQKRLAPDKGFVAPSPPTSKRRKAAKPARFRE